MTERVVPTYGDSNTHGTPPIEHYTGPRTK